MKGKQLLTAFLLGVSLCFVPVLGHGEVRHMWNEAKATLMEIVLLEARIDYMMRNPDVFLDVFLRYDSTGRFAREFPVNVNTKGKIFIGVQDNKRGGYSYKSGTALLELFKVDLKLLFAFVKVKRVVTNMDTDIVAVFYSRGSIPLGYFYQGEYHLWEK